jgi:hypothetical protein
MAMTDGVLSLSRTLRIACILSIVYGLLTAGASAQSVLDITDYATMPMTGLADGKTNNEAQLTRINALREEPGGANRFFVLDMNGPLYILDKQTKKTTIYLDFNGRDGRPGVFHRLFFETGYGNGLSSLYFDPDYRNNGKFYTVHIEDPALSASNLPDNARFPGLNVSGYRTTPPIVPPGPVLYEGVLIEWTDTNISNATFEGTARELMRIQLNGRIHPLGDTIFNPMARPGDPDWRVLYIACGDSGAGESDTSVRTNPQRLDNLLGKILRIIPDLSTHQATSTLSENGRYRIPNDNPFVSRPGARKEIWAYGLRNPQRLTWIVDPADSTNNRLVANSVGLHTWETVYFIRKGANYGYSLREGNQLLKADNTTAALPAVDRIPVMVSEITEETVVPQYPVIQYGHVPSGGDAIGAGFFYNGTIAALRGKYLFGDISTGRIWYADYNQMLAADDGKPDTLAPTHPLKIRWNGRTYDTFFPIVETTYHDRGGKDPDLPGTATVSGSGRADVRFAVSGAGELFLYSKSDGMIRVVTGAAN